MSKGGGGSMKPAVNYTYVEVPVPDTCGNGTCDVGEDPLSCLTTADCSTLMRCFACLFLTAVIGKENGLSTQQFSLCWAAWFL